MKEKKAWAWFLGMTVFLVCLDQASKAWAAAVLKGNSSIPVLPGVLELYYLYPENKGIAFGMFQNSAGVLLIVTGLLMLLLLWVFHKVPKTRYFFLIHLVCLLFFSGALGNLLDRVCRGYVIDFLYFSLISFPVFNLADTFVVAAAILMVLSGIFKYKDEEDFAWLKKTR